MLRRLLPELIAVTAFAVVTHSGARAAPRHLASDEAKEVAYLIGRGTADSLATAALLSHLIESSSDSDEKPDSTALMRRAVALAPDRPELLWLQLRDCELRQCDGEQPLVERLRAADPDNGLSLLPGLSASLRGPPQETTRLISRLGSAKTIRLYWNRQIVGMFDALTHGPRSPAATALSHAADDRLAHVTGVLAAIDLPPFRPITTACAPDQFAQAGRRAACESLMNRLDQSDAIIAQSLSISMHEKWASPGSSEAAVWRDKRLQQHYLVETSGRARGAKVNEDAVARVNAMRHLATEEAVDQAMLVQFGDSLERPAALTE